MIKLAVLLILVALGIVLVVPRVAAARQISCDDYTWWAGFWIDVDGELNSEMWPCDPPDVSTPVPTLVPTATATNPPSVPTFTRTPTRTPTPVPPTPTRTATPTTGVPSGVLIVGSGGYTTITQAMVAATTGKTISIKAGTYRETIAANKQGVSLQAYGNGPVVIDGECKRDNGVLVTASDVQIKGLTITKTRMIGVHISGLAAARTIVDGNTITDFNCQGASPAQNNAGVASWYGGPSQRITNNIISKSKGGGNGIWFKSNSSNASGGGHYIAGNTITGGYDGIGGEDEFDPRGTFDRNTTIERNTIRGCADDGIQSEGGGNGIIIQDNVIEQCGIALALASPLGSGSMTVQRNKMDSSTAGDYGIVVCVKLGHGQGSAMTINLWDNICDVDGTQYGSNNGKGIQQTNPGLTRLNVLRNRWNVTAYVYELEENPASGSVFNNNCMYTSDGGRFVKWGGQQYGNLSSLRSATGQEQQGLVGPC